MSWKDQRMEMDVPTKTTGCSRELCSPPCIPEDLSIPQKVLLPEDLSIPEKVLLPEDLSIPQKVFLPEDLVNSGEQ
jgi:hypothetical protein